MAAEGDLIRPILNLHLGNDIEQIWFTYTGEEVIPREVTHVIVNAELIPEYAFFEHPNIVEIICRENVKKIEDLAFTRCYNLRRVIMPGVKIVGAHVFCNCRALAEVECGKLEIIGDAAFMDCGSLRSIKLPSIMIVEFDVFDHCNALTAVQFGSKLERIDENAFGNCKSLERITIPLKDFFTEDNTFWVCEQLKQVDLVEGAFLQETIAALQLEGWRFDLKREIESINKILPTTPAGSEYYSQEYEFGQKARVIRWWIREVLLKVNHYKAEHQRVLNEAVSTLQLGLPRDIVMNNVIPFLALPSHTFDVEEQETEENDGVDEEM